MFEIKIDLEQKGPLKKVQCKIFLLSQITHMGPKIQGGLEKMSDWFFCQYLHSLNLLTKVLRVDLDFLLVPSRWIALDQHDVEGINSTKHPQQVMVLAILVSGGNRMPPIFFGPKEKYTAAVYCKILCYQVLP